MPQSCIEWGFVKNFPIGKIQKGSNVKRLKMLIFDTGY